ncbi:RimJ/RimL family protein N-acetyltransferase [Chitinivorax tropicus]|uniref:RimJ/RimL family protein N-acetyltransferase n=1 Tax=Chitinivorax tropicus TaxID=714531 RepID=A0A840MIX6_9PROT|nr:GNAT family N-acetyltransferase [Chitinivorax tropicus]MBB5017149.1 RimJ/RimL family protein N-acetyltransferase [Chitinivorax tropicus]
MSNPPVPPYFAQRNGIRIRPYTLDDATPYFWAVMASRQELAAWTNWFKVGYTLDDARIWVVSRIGAWQHATAFDFAVERVEDNMLLGNVGLNTVSSTHRYASMNFWIRTDACGQGVASSAMKLVAAFGFDVLNLARVELAIKTDNMAARKAAHNAGAAFEANARNRLQLAGKPVEAALYSLIPADVYAPSGEMRNTPFLGTNPSLDTH